MTGTSAGQGGPSGDVRHIGERIGESTSGSFQTTALPTLILGAGLMEECGVKDIGIRRGDPHGGVAGGRDACGRRRRSACRPPVRGGLGMRFIEIQNLDELDGLPTLSASRHKSLAARKLGSAA
jgi:hypothetical protein